MVVMVMRLEQGDGDFLKRKKKNMHSTKIDLV